MIGWKLAVVSHSENWMGSRTKFWQKNIDNNKKCVNCENIANFATHLHVGQKIPLQRGIFPWENWFALLLTKNITSVFNLFISALSNYWTWLGENWQFCLTVKIKWVLGQNFGKKIQNKIARAQAFCVFRMYALNPFTFQLDPHGEL